MDGSSSSEGSGGGDGSGLTLRIKFKSETPEAFVERYGADLSAGGIFIRAREPLSVGTQLGFAFSLQDGSSLLAGTGTVVWIREAAATPNGQPGMGIRFDRLSGDGQAMVARLLAEKARREREGRVVGSGSSVPSRPGSIAPELSGSSRPAAFAARPLAVTPFGGADESAPTAVHGEATARVELNPLTGEPIFRPTGVLSNQDAGESARGRVQTPFIGATAIARGPKRESTKDYRELRPAGTPPPIPAGATSPPVGGPARPSSTLPLGSEPRRTSTPAFGEPPPRRPTRSSMPVATRPPGTERRAAPSPITPSRGATPVPGGMAVRRSTPVPGEPSRRATPVPGARRATPLPGQPGRGRSPLPGDRSVPLSPLEGALSSTVADKTPAQGFGPGRVVERTRGAEEWEGEATEIADIPPEFQDEQTQPAGAVPNAVAAREGSTGSAESRPTNPDLPVGRVAAGLHRRPDQAPTVEAPIVGPGAASAGNYASTGDLAASLETPIMAPPPFLAPPPKKGGGKWIVAAVLVAGAAAAAVVVMRPSDQPPPTEAVAVNREPAQPAPPSEPAAAAPAAALEKAPAPEPVVAEAPKAAEPPPPAEEAAKPAEPAAAEPAAPPAPRKPAVVTRAPAPKPVRPAPVVRPRKPAEPEAPAAEAAPVAAAGPVTDVPSAAAEPSPAAEPVAAAETEYWLYVRSTPAGAEVLIDGEVEGKTPFSRRVFDVSRPYAVTIRKDGFESFDRVVSQTDSWVKKGNKGTLVVTAKLARGKKDAPAAAPEPTPEAAPSPDPVPIPSP